jgi:hypothetical protein
MRVDPRSGPRNVSSTAAAGEGRSSVPAAESHRPPLRRFNFAPAAAFPYPEPMGPWNGGGATVSYAAHALSSASGRAGHYRRDCSPGREDETVRVIRGLLLGCALSLPLWATIGLALHTTLG